MFLMEWDLKMHDGQEQDEYNKCKTYYGDMAYLNGIFIYQLF